MSVKKQSPAQRYIGKDSRISFGFGHLHDVSYTDCKQPTFFIDFLQRLKKICCVDWNTVNTSQRHAFGWEKISIGSIKRKKIEFDTRRRVSDGFSCHWRQSCIFGIPGRKCVSSGICRIKFRRHLQSLILRFRF